MNRLRELRVERGWTQEELGAKLKVQKSAISKYEIGRSALSDELIEQLCDIFSCSADYLLGLSNVRSCKKCPLTVGQGDRIIQSALKDTGLLAEDGSLTPGGEKAIREYLARNADILKLLVREKE
ncbi:MAG: helix-turn-helix transcriptional regulator [Oscillospiraceae bacterium]|nr:helix-turn-helix transcriptional regulator [Oscillospiraceae bacterium]